MYLRKHVFGIRCIEVGVIVCVWVQVNAVGHGVVYIKWFFMSGGCAYHMII